MPQTEEETVETTLRELVDLLPTQSLELYVQAYEDGRVGGYTSLGYPLAETKDIGMVDCTRCPRASLGFSWLPHGENLSGSDHPAYIIEWASAQGDLDTAALYSECVLAIAERDAATEPVRERCPA